MKRNCFGRLIGIVLALMCLSGICSARYVGAAEKYSNISNMKRDVTVTDDTAGLSLDDWNGRNGKIIFIAAAVNKSTGKLEKIAVDEKDGSTSGTLNFSVDIRQLKSAVNTELLYYLWGENQNSYVNCKPTNIVEYETESCAIENKIAWKEVYDDNNAVDSYRIYDNVTGEFLFETADCYYIDGRTRKIFANTDYSYKVIPIDSNGNVAEEENTAVISARTEPVYTWDEGRENGVSSIRSDSDAREAYAESVNKNGRECLLAPSSRSKRDNNWAYSLVFNVPAMESRIPYNCIYITVKYLDTAGGNLKLTYKYLQNDTGAYGNLTKQLTGPALQGSNEWKSYTFVINNPKAYLVAQTGNMSNGQFSLTADKGNDLYISNVEVAGEKYKLMPNSGLGTVRNLTAVSAPKRVTLSWNEPQNDGEEIKKYNIYDTSTGLLIGESHQTEFTDGILRELMPDASYSYRVVPVDAGGLEGVVSSDSDIEAKTKTIDVVNLTAEVIDGKIQIMWEPVDNTGEYIFYRIYEGGALLAETDELSYIDDRRLTLGSTYRYRVVPVDARGTEAPITNLSVIAATLPYDEVRRLRAEAKIEEVKLTWEPVMDTDRYAMYRIYDNETGEVLAETTDCYYIDGRDRKLVPDTKYEYLVVPVEANGEEGITSIVSVVEAITGHVYTWSADEYFNNKNTDRQGIKVQRFAEGNDSYFWNETIDGRTAAYAYNNGRTHSYFFFLCDKDNNYSAVQQPDKEQKYTITFVYSGGAEPDGGQLRFTYKNLTKNIELKGAVLDKTEWQEYSFEVEDACLRIESGQFSNAYFAIGTTNYNTGRFAIAEIRVAKTDELRF